MKIEEIFHVEMPIIGMLHLKALPGSPKYSSSFISVINTTLKDAEALVNGGVNGLIIENFGNVPYFPDHVPAHTTAYMTRIATEIKRRYDIPLGINVLRNDALSALGIACATEADFIRVNIHIGCMVTDQGLIQGKAYETLRLRTQLQSKVKIFADVMVKHAYPLGNQVLSQSAKDTYYRGKADVLIVSGTETGTAPSCERVQNVKNAVPEAPIFVGSGMSVTNIENYVNYANGFIIGTAFKKDNITTNPVDKQKVKCFIDRLQKIRD